jgi:integrase
MPRMGRRPDPRERVLGPYPHHRGWRIIIVGADGRRRSLFCASRADAERAKALAESKIASIIHTTETARASFVEDMKVRDLSPRTVEGYEWAIAALWPTAKPLRALTRENCGERYQKLRAELAVDSHRNALKMGKTFLRWCVAQGWMPSSPLEAVKGSGARKRGKRQLRIDEARRFYRHALERAVAGDHGAIAALLCLVLTLRSESEALSLMVRDLDDDGRLIVVEDAKTESGRRTEDVPDDLRPILLQLSTGLAAGEHGPALPPQAYLFRRRDRKWLWDEVARLCAEAGVPRVSPHGLRGMHATIAKSRGATSRMVADALGHQTTRVTEDHYIDGEQTRRDERRRTLTVLEGGKISLPNRSR